MPSTTIYTIIKTTKLLNFPLYRLSNVHNTFRRIKKSRFIYQLTRFPRARARVFSFNNLNFNSCIKFFYPIQRV